VVFPAPLMSTIQELSGFLAREATAATTPTPAPPPAPVPLAPAKVPAADAGSDGAPPATRRD
jgi:hypothetical protein